MIHIREIHMREKQRGKKNRIGRELSKSEVYNNMYDVRTDGYGLPLHPS